MNGKKNEIDPLAELTRSLASRTPSTSNLMASASSATRDRPISILDRLSTISDADLVKYLQSTRLLLKNRTLLAGLADSGAKIKSNLTSAEKEAEKRGLGDVDQQVPSTPEQTPSAVKMALLAKPSPPTSASKKILDKAGKSQPDLEHALQTLNLRDPGHSSEPEQHGPMVKTNFGTSTLVQVGQKAIPLSLEESLQLEQTQQESRQALLEEQSKVYLMQSSATGPTVDSLDHRKYQFLQYREADESGSLEGTSDQDDDVIEEDSEGEEEEQDAVLTEHSFLQD